MERHISASRVLFPRHIPFSALARRFVFAPGGVLRRCCRPAGPATCHRLIIGHSGSGKSFIVSKIGRPLNLPVLLINISSCVVLSARNNPWTASTIC